MSPVEVIAAHKQLGATRFIHRNGQSWVEYPKCGCGERMHPSSHAQHVLDALAESGYGVTTVAQSEAIKTLRELHYYVLDFCDEYVCASCGQNPCSTLAALDPG